MPPAFPRILSLVFLACFASWRPDPPRGVGQVGAPPEIPAVPASHRSSPIPALPKPPLLAPNPPVKPNSSPLQGPARICQVKAAKPCTHKSPA